MSWTPKAVPGVHTWCVVVGGCCVLASAGACGLGAWCLEFGPGHCGLSFVSRGRRYGRVGVAALGNSVFRVECICMGVGPRHALQLVWSGRPGVRSVGLRAFGFVLWAPGLFGLFGFCCPAGRLPGLVVFVLWASGFPHVCASGFLVLLARVRGLACM